MAELHIRELDDIESIINESPDSALNRLSSIDHTQIISSKTKARFNLLYSIALDKTGNDIRSDSLISPALKYYSRRMPSRHKLMTFYYTARIYENNEKYPEAMEYLAKSEAMLDEIPDRDIAALMYAAKGRIYNRTLEYQQAGMNFNKAAAEYRISGNMNRYIANRLRAADCLLMYGAIEDSDLIISEIEKISSELNQSNLNRLYLIKLRRSEAQNPESTEEVLKSYLDSISDKAIIDWLYVTRIYISRNNLKEAFSALEMYKRYDDASASYHYWLGMALEMSGQYKESLEEFKKYTWISGTIGKNILSQDTKFVEERFRNQSLLEKEKNRRIVLSLAFIIILLGLALATAIIISIRKELKIRQLKEENLQTQLDELMLEREELAALEDRNYEGRKIISERLRIIDQFVMSDAFNDSIFEAKASQTLKDIIGNRAEFVRQNRLIFNQSVPKFINHLTDKGLTDIEIDHCCLYAIGMNGKMVTTFTKAKRHYHIGSDVRKKLGLCTHDTNISIYIRNLYKQLQV
jgi:tetratricopeptide (TPR) repeat protein